MDYLGKKSAAVSRISPGDAHYFFGYYDLQPYNADESLYLTHKTDFRNRLQGKSDVAETPPIYAARAPSTAASKPWARRAPISITRRPEAARETRLPLVAIRV